MAIENGKLVNLQDAKVLYGDLRNRVESVSESIGTVPTGETVEGQIDELDVNKAPVIKETLSTEAAIAEITDAADLPVKVTVGIEPVQDLHGYDNPWIGGGGKNKFRTTATTDTVSGVTFTVNSDGSVKVSGSPSASVSSYIFGEVTLPAGTYNANGLASGASNGMRMIVINKSTSAVLATVYGGNDVEFTLESETTIKVYPIIPSSFDGTAVTFYPMIRLSTETDATFAPYSNICPISGWTGCKVTRTGKNFVDVSLADWKLDYRISDDVEEVSNAAYKFTQYYYRVNGGGTVSVSFVGDSGYTSRLISMAVYDSNKQFIERVTLINTDTPIPSGYNKATATLPNGASYVRFTFPKGLGITNMMLEYAPDATEYEPFGTTYNITFPAGAGTVYGGELTVNKDGSGSLIVDKAMVNLKNLTNGQCYLDKTDNSTSFNIFKTNNYSDRKYGTGTDKAFISAEYVWQGSNTAGGFRSALKNGFCGGQASSVMMWFRDDRIADDTLYPTDDDKKTAFKTLLTDGTIVYPLANPISYQFTPGQVKSLLGYNAMWADTGNIKSLEYCADTKLYIDSFNPVPSMIAANNIASGKYFMVGNKLYISTEAIAQGATITPGTNCTAISLADALNTISE